MRERPAIIAPPPLLAAGCILAGFVASHYWALPFFPGPRPIRIAVGVLLFLGAVLIFVLAQREFMAHNEHPSPYRATNTIFGTGIYSRSRNPIYIAMMIVVLAVGVTANDAWFLIALPVLFLLLRFGVVSAEETYLSEKFGANYDDYRRRVRRWI